MNQNKLKKIVYKLRTGLEPVESFDELDAGIKQLTKKLHKQVEAKSLDSVNQTLESFRKDIDLSPIKSALEKLKSETGGIYAELGRNVENRTTELTTRAENALRTLESIQNDNGGIKKKISTIEGDSKLKENALKDISDKQAKSASELSSVRKDINKLIKELDEKILTVGKGAGEAELAIIDLREELKKLRADLLSLMNRGGGGNMNRQIKVGGVDVLTKYTDINLVAGAGISLTTANDNTDKNVDITISSGADLSVTLADVSANSTDTAKSLYTMTSDVPVEFRSSDGNRILELDETNEQVIIGEDSDFQGDSQFPVVITRTVNDFIALEIQNLSTGDSASTDISVSADNDGTDLIGHYIDMGINGSGYSSSAIRNVKTVTVGSGGTAYTVGDILTIVGGDSNATVTVLTVDGSGVVLTIELTDNGTGYVVGNNYTTTGGTGTGALINVTSVIDNSLYTANDGYVYVSGGNLLIGTDDGSANRAIKFHVGGFGTTNEVGNFAATGGFNVIGSASVTNALSFGDGSTQSSGAINDFNWNIGTFIYNSVSFATTGQDAQPTHVFFRPDGLKMYVLGDTNNRIFQYSLSTAWVVSTATYDSITSPLLTSQDPSPEGMFFKPDGTKVYVAGNSNDKVFQYTLPTPWVLTGMTYDNVSFSVVAQDTALQAVTFKSDGRKMYVSGSTNDTIYQYTLSTPWNLSTASYDSISISVAGQENAPLDVQFKPDGTQMYVCGSNSVRVRQYVLSTPWNIGTAVYTGQSFSTSSQDTSPRGMFFKPDGSRLFITGAANDIIIQYDLGIMTNGTIAVGTLTPMTEIHAASTSTTSPRGIMSSQHNTGTEGARFHMRKSRGTNASPTVIVTGDEIGRIVGAGYGGSSYLEMAAIIMGSEGTIASTRVPTNIQFWTGTNVAPSVLTEAMRITSSQTVGIGTTTPTALLHVAGTTRITGAMSTEENYNPINQGQIMYFPFSEGSGTTVTDRSPSGAIGTISAPVWTSGKFGSALTFSLSTSFVNVPHNANQLLTTGLTVSAWVYPTSGLANNDKIVDKSSGSTGLTGFSLDSGTPSGSGTRVGFTINAGTKISTPVDSVPFDKWTHVVATVDSSGNVVMYINGASVATGTTSLPSEITTTNDLRIGGRSISTSNVWDGNLDEVKIWNRVLTADEVMEDYWPGVGTQGFYTKLNTGFNGIGTTAPVSILHVASNTTGQAVIFEQASADTDSFDLSFRKARGTFTTPTVITTGDSLGQIMFRGYSGSGGYVTAANILAVSEGTIASSRVGAYLSFSTGTNASPTVLTEAMRITSTQRVAIGAITDPNSQVEINTTNAGGSGGTLRISNRDNTINTYAELFLNPSATSSRTASLRGINRTGSNNIDLAIFLSNAASAAETARFRSDGVFVVGAGEQSATPVGNTIRAPIAVQQLDTVAGATLTLAGSNAVAGSTNAGAAAGGGVTITGGNATRLTSGNADGGAITITAGNGVAAGTGGAVLIQGGASTTGAGSTGGAVTVKTQDTSLAGSSVPGTLTLQAGASTFVSGNSTPAGGAVNIITGNSATNSSTNINPGSTGGALTVTIGEGGDVSGNGTTVAGTGGALTVTGGAGGDATGAGGTHTGGVGTTISITSGAGGSATGASGTRTGGNSGNIVIRTGAVGTGATANGVAGTITLGVAGGTDLTIDSSGITNTKNLYPITDDTYYLGKNDDDSPKAWKGVILKDTTNGKYYRVEVISGVLTATDLTD